jgi:uncharacterized protein
MRSRKSVKVIFDTNIWISFLIGKQLQSIKDHIANNEIIIVLSDQLLHEITIVTQRPKLHRYFPQQRVDELLDFLRIAGHVFNVTATHQLLRDAKDNFLLDLIDVSKADFLVTGDKDVLELGIFKTAKILTPSEFEKEIR